MLYLVEKIGWSHPETAEMTWGAGSTGTAGVSPQGQCGPSYISAQVWVRLWWFWGPLLARDLETASFLPPRSSLWRVSTDKPQLSKVSLLRVSSNRQGLGWAENTAVGLWGVGAAPALYGELGLESASKLRFRSVLILMHRWKLNAHSFLQTSTFLHSSLIVKLYRTINVAHILIPPNVETNFLVYFYKFDLLIHWN